MILPNLRYEVVENYKTPYYNIDNINLVSTYSPTLRKKLEGVSLTKEEFEAYPKKIMYEFNSRGLRDAEWPNSIDELKDSFFCVGDSNVVGVGLAYEDMFVQVLSNLCDKRMINCGVVNAKNYFWTMKQSIDIIKELNPKVLIAHWGAFHKSVLHKPRFFAHDDRRDIELTLNYIKNLEENKGTTKVIHVFNPIYHDFYDFFKKIDDMDILYVKFIRQDYARDAVHYGIESHKQLANDLYNIIKNS
jgi:hypothetical protein